MKSPEEQRQETARRAPTGGAETPHQAIDSATLLQGRDAVRIAHGTDIYTLRRTRQNKLILTK